MLMDYLMGRMDDQSILPITVNTMLNLSEGGGVGMCKQALMSRNVSQSNFLTLNMSWNSLNSVNSFWTIVVVQVTCIIHGNLQFPLHYFSRKFVVRITFVLI